MRLPGSVGPKYMCDTGHGWCSRYLHTLHFILTLLFFKNMLACVINNYNKKGIIIASLVSVADNNCLPYSGWQPV
jgi:hypothetical protein